MHRPTEKRTLSSRVHDRREGAPEIPHAVLTTSLSLLDGLRARDSNAWRSFVALYAPLIVHWCHRQGLKADVSRVLRRLREAVGGRSHMRRPPPGRADPSLKKPRCNLSSQRGL